MKPTLIASLFIFAATSALAAGSPSLTGQWTVHNSIAGNESDQECKFVQTETKLTGKSSPKSSVESHSSG